MGREAICVCNWAGDTVEVKALLESNEVILRGAIRKRLPFRELQEVKAQSDRLCFTVGREPVQLFLGLSAAGKWAAAITSPPQSLAKKLGVTNKTVVRIIGTVRDRALNSALEEAARNSAGDADLPDLMVACVDTPESLHEALLQAKAQLAKSVPIWVVYPKGPGHPLNESMIRSLLRASGMMDTKVASVSTKLTALRFNRPKSD
jgi:hypothetical protein